jgi:CHRD domain
MRLRVFVPLAAAALVAAMILPAAAFAHGTHVKAKLSGSKVVGAAGAPNGNGTANLHLLRGKGQVKYKVKFSKIGGKAGLDIAVYKGKKGQNGAEQFDLVGQATNSPAKGKATGISAQTLKKITRNPHRYHVTVKNDTYPTDGAIRGQLKANPNA